MKEYGFILAPLLGWFIAQFIKYIFSLRKDGFSLSDLISSGGFPSSHAAFVMSLTTLVGLSYGIKSVNFAMCAVFSAIILYDTVGVRKTVGDQTVVINKMIISQKIRISNKIHVSRGHTMIEMLAGALLGMAVGTVTYYIFK